MRARLQAMVVVVVPAFVAFVELGRRWM